MESGRTIDKELQPHSLLHIFWYEFLGTGLFVLIYNMARASTFSVNVGNEDANPLILGLTIFVLVQLCWNISGAHFNPCVSIAVYSSEGFKSEHRSTFFTMILAQLLGSYFGMLLFYLGV
jgi:glycerol uptake facilitator-like aquaporin